MVLQPDDFEIGMYITVLDNLPYKKETEAFDTETFTATVKTIINEDRSGMGRILQIIAINLPYIICKNHSQYKRDVYNSSWDTRRVKFIPLSSDYVKASLEQKET